MKINTAQESIIKKLTGLLIPPFVCFRQALRFFWDLSKKILHFLTKLKLKKKAGSSRVNTEADKLIKTDTFCQSSFNIDTKSWQKSRQSDQNWYSLQT